MADDARIKIHFDFTVTAMNPRLVANGLQRAIDRVFPPDGETDGQIARTLAQPEPDEEC